MSLGADSPQIAEAIRSTPQAVALTRIVTDLRPDWTAHDVYRWCLSDDRPWATVCRVGILGAADPGVRHPNGLRHVNPSTGDAPTPVPPPVTEVYMPLRTCEPHGGIVGACPQCRTTTRTEVVA